RSSTRKQILRSGSLQSCLTSRSLRSGRLDSLNLQRDVDAVSYNHATCFQHLVPGQAKVAAVECSGPGNSHALIAPRVFGLARVLHLQAHFPSDAANGQVTHEPVPLATQLFHPSALKAETRELLDVQKVRGSQVVIAFGDTSINARSFHLHFHA